ncbi:arginyltransferase [Spartinivicinus ruber]|uniref:arginyltransferase n=1 Tax=Spartinivicinus ruber TaxID=2683272 RepID=UPI0013D3E0C3|nr:arginyltransferase [Spartinivicinus ruber]
MSNLKALKFYATQPHTCSYLPKQQATTLFLDPDIIISKPLYSQLTDLGFRRSGQHLYRPHCEACCACTPVRVKVDEFKYKRRFQRILKTNQDISLRICPPHYCDEYYELYARYIEARHADGDMFPPSKEQFNSFLVGDWSFCKFMECWLDNKLVAVAVMDELTKGLSAIYTFFEPELTKHSLGTYCILQQIYLAKSLGLPYVYLGYWIKECQKMSYKTEFRPLEIYLDHQWLAVL